MKKIIVSISVIALLISASIVSAYAFELKADVSEDLESIVIKDMDPFDGYILYTPWYGMETYLINNTGEVVHKWSSLTPPPALPVYLLENGSLLRAGHKFSIRYALGRGATGRVEMFNWVGQKIWNFEYANNKYHLHHDIEPLPNGNILMIAWEYKTRDEAIAAGRNPENINIFGMWPDHIIEVEPIFPEGGNIVWEWHAWDHLIQDFDPTKDNYGVVADHPELIDINLGKQAIDWLHTNSIYYNKRFDQIVLSSALMNEIWIIDHSINTTEAAGPGGDLLYRWGNPQNYHRGDETDQKLFWQHDARWIENGYPGEGHITLYNNYCYRRNYSSVLEIVPPVDENGNYILEPDSAYGPEEPIWVYTGDPLDSFFSIKMSGAQRLPNGNTLICSADQARFFEVTPEKETIWEYFNPFPLLIDYKGVFKIQYYPPDYPGIEELLINIENVTAESGVIVSECSQNIHQQSLLSGSLSNN